MQQGITLPAIPPEKYESNGLLFPLCRILLRRWSVVSKCTLYNAIEICVLKNPPAFRFVENASGFYQLRKYVKKI